MLEKQQAILVVQVQPNASKNDILGFKQEALRVRIAAPPFKGRANRELIKFVSGILEVSQNCLTIQKGTTGKRKVITIRGLTQDQVTKRIADWTSGSQMASD